MALPSAFKYMYLAKTRATKFCSLSDRVGVGGIDRRETLNEESYWHLASCLTGGNGLWEGKE